MIKGNELLQLLYNLLIDRILERGYVYMDEASVQVLKEPRKMQKVKFICGFEKPVILIKRKRLFYLIMPAVEKSIPKNTTA